SVLYRAACLATSIVRPGGNSLPPASVTPNSPGSGLNTCTTTAFRIAINDTTASAHPSIVAINFTRVRSGLHADHADGSDAAMASSDVVRVSAAKPARKPERAAALIDGLRMVASSEIVQATSS